MTESDEVGQGWVYRLTTVTCGIAEERYYASPYEARVWLGKLRDAGISTRMDRAPASSFAPVSENDLDEAARGEIASRSTARS